MRKYYITISEDNLFDSLGKEFIHPLNYLDKYKDKTGSFSYDNIILVSDTPQYININKENKYILLTIELNRDIVKNIGEVFYINEILHISKINELTISDKKNHQLLLNFNFRNFNIKRFVIKIYDYQNIFIENPEISLNKEFNYNLQIKLIASLYTVIKYDYFKYKEISDITKIILNILFNEKLKVNDSSLEKYLYFLKKSINYIFKVDDYSKDKKLININNSKLLIIEVIKIIINDFDYTKNGRSSLNIDEYFKNIINQIFCTLETEYDNSVHSLKKHLFDNNKIINKRSLLENENTWFLGIIEILKDVLLEDSICKIDSTITHFRLENLTRLIVLTAESFFNGFSAKDYEFKADEYLINLLLIKTNELFEIKNYSELLQRKPYYIYSKSGFIISENMDYYKNEYYNLIAIINNKFTNKEYESIYVNALNYLFHNVSLVNNEFIKKVTKTTTLLKLSLRKIEKNKGYLLENEDEYIRLSKSIENLREIYINNICEKTDKYYNDKLIEIYTTYFIETIIKKTNTFSKSILNKNVLKKSMFKLYKENEKYLLNNINNIKIINVFLQGELDNVDK